MARKRSDLTRKASGVDGPDLNETYRESMAEAEAADAAPKPPRQNRPKPSCMGRLSGMKAWPQPYTNRVCVLVCDLLLAGLLGGAGAWLYIASQAHASSGLIHYACADSQTNPRTCACDGAAECTVAFTLERDIPAPSFLMYQLENFKQAHRGYVKSVSWDQLTASSVEEAELATAEVGDDGECGDSRKALRAEGNATGPVLFPCGLFAQFVYNDTLELRGADGATVPTDETQLEPGIGPRVYKGDAFEDYGGRWRNTTSPRWRSWVRASPFELRKPYGKIGVDLPAGDYTMKVTNDFDASIFLGSKAFVITHYDDMVGNPLSYDGLAYAAMATGGLALLLALFVGFLMIKGAPVDRKCNELEDAYKPIEKEIRRDSSFAEEMEGETPGMREDSTAAAALAEKELEVRRGLELIARYAAAPTVDALEKLVSTQRRTLPIVRRAKPAPPALPRPALHLRLTPRLPPRHRAAAPSAPPSRRCRSPAPRPSATLWRWQRWLPKAPAARPAAPPRSRPRSPRSPVTPSARRRPAPLAWRRAPSPRASPPRRSPSPPCCGRRARCPRRRRPPPRPTSRWRRTAWRSCSGR